MYQVLLNNSFPHEELSSLIGDYYTPMDLLFNTSNTPSHERQIYQYADRILMQSMYLIPIVHYGRIMG